MHTVVRVKRLVDGKAVGKSFRVYRFEEKELGGILYLTYSVTSIIDDDFLDFEVTEDYERLAQPAPRFTIVNGKRINREGYVRKSSKCPRMEPTSEKGKLKTKRKKLRAEKKELQKIRERTPEIQKQIDELIVKNKEITAEMRALSIKRGNPVHNTIIVRARGGSRYTKRKLLKVNVSTSYVKSTKDETA